MARSWKSQTYRALRYSNDLNAIEKGRVGRRVGRRVFGRATGKLMRGLFR